MTDIIKESLWFINVCCFFTVGSVIFLQLLFVIFVGKELAEIGFVRGKCEKNFENHCVSHFSLYVDLGFNCNFPIERASQKCKKEVICQYRCPVRHMICNMFLIFLKL